MSHRLHWNRVQDDTTVAKVQNTPGTIRRCWSANAEDAQEFSDVERATETLAKNSHHYSVEGGKETVTNSEL